MALGRVTRGGAALVGQSCVRAIATSGISCLELDLYADVNPFHDGVPPDVLSFSQPNLPSPFSAATALPPLLLPTEQRLTQSNITESVFLVHKKSGELLDQLVLSLAKTFKAKSFYIATSGDLDILASGIALLCCGKSVDALDDFDGLPHHYRGILKLGQVTSTHDLKSCVHTYTPWKHVTDEMLKGAAGEFVGDILLPPPPFTATRSKTPGLYYILRENLDRSHRPCVVESFSVHRFSSSSRDVHFELVCDAVLAPESLIHALGEKLDCGAMLYELERLSIGPYTLEQAWDTDLISKAFSEALRGNLHSPSDPTESYLKQNALRYIDRIVGRNWHHEWRSEKKVKIKPFEKRRRKQERMQMEAEGLISDEEIMKRKLKKKAVKLVANLNVPAIERIYTKIMEE